LPATFLSGHPVFVWSNPSIALKNICSSSEKFAWV
jgi:hypothetical protein